MISRKIINNWRLPIIKTKDLNKNFKQHGLIKSYKQQLISRIIINSYRSSRIKTKDLNKILN